MLFQDFRVFTGERVLHGVDVLVSSGRVVAVGHGLAVPGPAVPGARGRPVVRGAGRTLLPGLIDAHVHVLPGASRQAVRFGVTTQLDMFAEPHVLRVERAAGPDAADLRSAGIGATAPGGHPGQYPRFSAFPTVSDARSADAFVAARVAEGSDYLKVFASSAPGEPGLPTLSPAVVAALVTAAHDRGLRVVVHATDQEAALVAVRTGADGLAHLPFDRPPCPAFVAALAPVFVVPTLTAAESFCQVPHVVDLRVAARLDADALANLADRMEPRPAPHYRPEHACRAVRPLRDAGVALLAGTDAGVPGTAYGASLHRELELLVEAGLTPVEALAAATSAPARCFGLRDRGRIAPGLRADLVVVAGDPTRRITDSAAVAAVYRGGRLVGGDA
ncbi:amidohydrolase family protein [Actinosynnema sp. NPDC059797]